MTLTSTAYLYKTCAQQIQSLRFYELLLVFKNISQHEFINCCGNIMYTYVFLFCVANTLVLFALGHAIDWKGGIS